MMFVPHRKHRPPLPVTVIALPFLYVNDVRTSQEAQTSTACYGNSFTFFYADDVRTSQKTCVSRYGLLRGRLNSTH
jgi:hypothetical protein